MDTLNNENNKTKIGNWHIEADSQQEVPKLSLSTDKTIRKAGAVMLVIVVLASGIMSWKGLLELGMLAGMGWSSFLLPLSIDGCLLLGSLQTLHAVLGKRKSRYGLLLTCVGVGLSIAGNMYSSWSLGVLPASVHAIPPLMLFLSLHGFELIMKHRLASESKTARAVRSHRSRSKAPSKETVATPKKTPQTGAQSLSGGANKVAPTPNEESIESLREKLPESASKADRIRMILAEDETVTPSQVAQLLRVETKSISNTFYRIRKEMEAGESRSLRAV